MRQPTLTRTTISVPEELLEVARKLDINVSATARIALQREVRRRKLTEAAKVLADNRGELQAAFDDDIAAMLDDYRKDRADEILEGMNR